MRKVEVLRQHKIDVDAKLAIKASLGKKKPIEHSTYLCVFCLLGEMLQDRKTLPPLRLAVLLFKLADVLI